MQEENWANCIHCKDFFVYEDKQACRMYDIVGLPEKDVVNSNNKCCSSFLNHKTKYRMPNISKMEIGVLYFYHSKSPNILIQDIDL